MQIYSDKCSKLISPFIKKKRPKEIVVTDGLFLSVSIVKGHDRKQNFVTHDFSMLHI